MVDVGANSGEHW